MVGAPWTNTNATNMTPKQPNPIAPEPNRARKAPDVLRETDGRRQLVGYLGWKTILSRLAARRP